MDWVVLKNANTDAEREHLNKILKDIKAALESSGSVGSVGATGPRGPRGPAGEDGEDGEQGTPYSPIKTVSSGPYTLILSDAADWLNFTTGMTVTIPPQSSVAWEDDTQIEGWQGGTGQVTFQGDTGVTLQVPSTRLKKTAEQYSVFGLKRVAEDVWVIFGDLEGV